MTQEQHIRNLRERRSDILDQMDTCDSELESSKFWKQSEKLWAEIQLAESELEAKREEARESRLEGKS